MAINKSGSFSQITTQSERVGAFEVGSDSSLFHVDPGQMSVKQSKKGAVTSIDLESNPNANRIATRK